LIVDLNLCLLWFNDAKLKHQTIQVDAFE
jgi:hypothetical protein